MIGKDAAILEKILKTTRKGVGVSPHFLPGRGEGKRGKSSKKSRLMADVKLMSPSGKHCNNNNKNTQEC